MKSTEYNCSFKGLWLVLLYVFNTFSINAYFYLMYTLIFIGFILALLDNNESNLFFLFFYDNFIFYNKNKNV